MKYASRPDNRNARSRAVLAQAAEILKLRAYGVTIGDLAVRFDTTARTIQKALRRARKNV